MKAIYLLASSLIGFYAGATSPEIKWLETEHNFGAFDEDNGVATCLFRYVNTGDAPLVVLDVHTSCGCTTPDYSTAPVAPGDTAAITVKYDPAGRPGRFNKKIQVDTNTPAKRSKLTITGVVVGSSASVARRYPVEMDAMKLRNGAVMFGQVSKGHLKSVFVEGYNRSNDTIRPAVAYKPDCVDIVFEPAAVGPGEQVSIVCYYHSSKNNLYGLVEDSVSIIPDKGKAAYTMPLTAIINEDFSRLTPGERAKAPEIVITDKTVDFGRLPSDGGAVSRTFEIENRGKSTLEIRRVYTTDPGVTVNCDKTSVKKGKHATVTITVDPAALPGSLLNARISIIANDPDHPTTVIRAVGQLAQ